MQRERDPSSYEDARVSYEKRPSIWVEPQTPWQGGAIRLLELPSKGEGEDNIGAGWLPPANVGAGGSMPMAYRLYFGQGVREPNDVGRVMATRWSPSGETTRFVVDFDVDGASSDSGQPPEAVVSATRGQVTTGQTRRDPSGKYWRVTFDATPQTGQIMEMRAFLRRDGRTLTETWSFAWPR